MSVTTRTATLCVAPGITTWSLNVSLNDDTACDGSAATDVALAAACARMSTGIGGASSSDRPQVENGAVNGTAASEMSRRATP